MCTTGSGEDEFTGSRAHGWIVGILPGEQHLAAEWFDGRDILRQCRRSSINLLERKRPRINETRLDGGSRYRTKPGKLESVARPRFPENLNDSQRYVLPICAQRCGAGVRKTVAEVRFSALSPPSRSGRLEASRAAGQPTNQRRALRTASALTVCCKTQSGGERTSGVARKSKKHFA